MSYEILKNQHKSITHPKTNKPTKLYKIIALEDFEVVNKHASFKVTKGQIGGWVESESNLEQGSWVAHDACVFDIARVSENSIIRDNSLIYQKATVTDSYVSDRCFVHGEAKIVGSNLAGNSTVKDSSMLISSTMKNSSEVSGKSVVTDSSLSGGSRVNNSAVIGSVFEDVSEAVGNASVNNCKFSGRTVVRGGKHVNESRREEIELTVTTNNNN